MIDTFSETNLKQLLQIFGGSENAKNIILRIVATLPKKTVTTFANQIKLDYKNQVITNFFLIASNLLLTLIICYLLS